jgi:hypothetical protein
MIPAPPTPKNGRIKETRTQGGSYFHTYPIGRLFVYVSLDRIGSWGGFYTEERKTLEPIGLDLAWLFTWRHPSGCSAIPGFGVSGHFYMPTPVAKVGVEALWYADHGQLIVATAIGRPIHDACVNLHPSDGNVIRNKAEGRKRGVEAYDQVVEALRSKL